MCWTFDFFSSLSYCRELLLLLLLLLLWLLSLVMNVCLCLFAVRVVDGSTLAGLCVLTSCIPVSKERGAAKSDSEGSQLRANE